LIQALRRRTFEVHRIALGLVAAPPSSSFTSRGFGGAAQLRRTAIVELRLCKNGSSYVPPEQPTIRRGETSRTYVKWLSQHGAGEAYEHKRFVHVRHRQASGTRSVNFDVTETTDWSYVAGASETIFSFRLTGPRVVDIVVPALAAPALIASLKRKSMPNDSLEQATAAAPAIGASRDGSARATTQHQPRTPQDQPRV
jgi:hypothetical protein